MEPLFVFFVWFFMFLAVSTSPLVLQLYDGVLQCCFAVKIQKSFVDEKTSDFPDLKRYQQNILNLSKGKVFI